MPPAACTASAASRVAIMRTFEVPQDLADEEFRIKVYPSAPAWSPVSGDLGVKTNPLVAERDHQVRVWLEG